MIANVSHSCVGSRTGCRKAAEASISWGHVGVTNRPQVQIQANIRILVKNGPKPRNALKNAYSLKLQKL